MTRSDDQFASGTSPEAVEPALLAQAVQLALDNAAAGQLPFGALVVRDGTVVATG